MGRFIRVYCLVVAAILLVSVPLLAQHSSGGGSSSGGFSGGASSGGSAHGGSTSSGSSGSGHVGSSGGSRNSPSSGSVHEARTSSNARIANVKPANVKPAKRSFFSFLRHRKPALEAKIKPTIGCKKGENCTCAGGGGRNAAGMCVSGAQFLCSGGEVWNGFACGRQAWFNDCRSLANQLAAQERQMQGQGQAGPGQNPGQSPGQSLRHQMLLQQYQQCLQRSRMQPFSAYALNDARALDIH